MPTWHPHPEFTSSFSSEFHNSSTGCPSHITVLLDLVSAYSFSFQEPAPLCPRAFSPAVSPGFGCLWVERKDQKFWAVNISQSSPQSTTAGICHGLHRIFQDGTQPETDPIWIVLGYPALLWERFSSLPPPDGIFMGQREVQSAIKLAIYLFWYLFGENAVPKRCSS